MSNKKRKQIEKVFTQIYNQKFPMILTYCRSYMKNHHAAENCAENVFCRLYEKIGRLKLSTNIDAWLFKAAKYEMDHYFRKNREKFLEDENLFSKSDGFDVEENACPNSLKEILEKEEYDILEEFYINGEEIESIAKKRGVTKNAMYQRIYRIKMKVREKYEMNSDDKTN